MTYVCTFLKSSPLQLLNSDYPRYVVTYKSEVGAITRVVGRQKVWEVRRSEYMACDLHMTDCGFLPCLILTVNFDVF